MRTSLTVLFSVLGLALVAGCPPQAKQGAEQPGAQESADEHAAHQPAAPAAVPATAEADGDNSKLGEALTDAELVDVAAIIKAPDDYKGKRIRVQGKVRGMCHHRRNWFAIEASDAPDAYLRVVTEPAFLVPAGSIGKQAKTEGTLEVTEVNAETARHYAEDHRLGEVPAEPAPIKQIVLRAVGAEFI